MIDVKIIKKAKSAVTGNAGGGYGGASGGVSVPGLSSSVATLTNIIESMQNVLIPVDINGARVDWSSPYLFAVKSVKGFYSDEFLSAHGLNPFGGGGGAAYDRLDAWADYSTDREGWVLSALLGHDLHTRLEAIEGDYVKLSELPSLTGYATEQWVLGKGYITQDALTPYLTKTDASSLYQPKGNYLTSHQTLHTLTLQLNGTEIGTFNPTANKTINIGDVASAAALASHTSNTTVHISATERALWNKAASDLSTILGSDSDTVINKWEEVVAFLDTYTEADTLAGLLGNKVDKVAGYGLSKNDFNDTLLAKLNGIEAGANRYVLPTASATVKGGAMIGSGLMMASEVLSVNLNASHIPALDWSKIATGKPTTLGGYGITDAYTRAESNGLFAPAVVYNYSNGCLVRLTTLEHRSSMLTVLIEGNSYYGEQPIKSIIQFYNYDTPTAPVLACGATHYGRDFGNINAFNYDGHVYVWFKQSDGLSTFAVTAIESAGDFRIGNAVESITDAPMPADGVTRLVTITPSKGLRTDNYASVLDSRYLQPSALERYVTIDTEQTISGNKNFTGIVRITDTSATHDINTLPQLYFSIPGWCYSKFVYSKDDKLHLLDGGADLTGAHRTFVAGAFVKHGGTASQFLKADGSVDDNSYALASSLSDYLPLAGGTITGNLGIGLASSVAPAYKLDVNGTARISEGLLIGGLLSANGGISTNAITATEIHLGPITLKYEATNKGLQVIGGGLYTDSYLSAHGPSPTTVDYEARITALENKIAQLESRLNA